MGQMVYKANNSRSCKSFITQGVGNKRTKIGYSFKVANSPEELQRLRNEGFISSKELVANASKPAQEQAKPAETAKVAENDTANG